MKLSKKAAEKLRNLNGFVNRDGAFDFALDGKTTFIVEFPDQRQVFILDSESEMNKILEETKGGIAGNAYFDEQGFPRLHG